MCCASVGCWSKRAGVPLRANQPSLPIGTKWPRASVWMSISQRSEPMPASTISGRSSAPPETTSACGMTPLA